MIDVTASIRLDDAEIEERFYRAGGPGGQNVNKVSTAVQLRFDAARSPAFNDFVRERLIRLAGRRATSEGVIVLTAQKFRSQERNRADALERLVALIREAATPPPPPRRPTKPTKSAKRKRLDEKGRRGAIKAGRSAPSSSDDG